MSNIFMFILVFNTLCFAQNFDNYKTSDQQTVHINIKRSPIDVQPSDVHVTNPDLSDSKPKVEQSKDSLSGKDKELHDPQKANVLKEGKKDTEHEIHKAANATIVVHDSSTNVTTEKKELNKKHSDGREKGNIPMHGKERDDHQGALMRAFYVFLGISTLLIIYFVFKSFRLRQGAPPPSTVRKYGVVGRRSDMEMLPLPLAEDEDDDTLFEVGSHTNR